MKRRLLIIAAFLMPSRMARNRANRRQPTGFLDTDAPMRPFFCYLSFFLAAFLFLGGLVAITVAILLITQLHWWSLAVFAGGAFGLYFGAIGWYETKCHLRGHVPW